MSFRLRPGRAGLELRLHDLEATIMELIWSRGLEAFPVGAVLTLLERQREIAYTTVMTTVSRLHDKGLLSRVKDGKRYLYSAKLTREQFLEATAREVLQHSVGGPQALALLAEQLTEASASELDELEALIRRRRRELGT